MSDSEIVSNSYRKAIVIGGSIAGLLVARILSDRFEQVTIIESDSFPTQPQWRPGVPQSHHAHILLSKGWQILEPLFPGLQDELAQAGAPLVDWTAEFPLLGLGGWFPRFASHIKTHPSSRNLLEWSIRKRLINRSNISFLQGNKVIGLLSDTDNTCISGVQIGDRHFQTQLTANLIVDASGRNSQTPQWLKALNYNPPEETEINSFLGYASRWYQRPKHIQHDFEALYLLPKPPHLTRGGGYYPVEENCWIVTLIGVARDYPPTDEVGFLEFAKTLHSPLLYEAIKEAQPISPIYCYRNTGNRLRHYEKLSRFPENFVVMGDAVCAFNPIYGQGMTVAAWGALTLKKCLEQQPQNNLTGLSKRFQKQLAKVNTTPWLMATAEDFRWTTTEGGSPNLVTKLMHRYLDQVMLLAVESPETYQAWFEVMHLKKTPTSLFQPEILMRLVAKAIYQNWQNKGNIQEQTIPKRPNSPTDTLKGVAT
jgi:2-polyprenyl-6-methoxyphenol hydroxylase-like FAD-dependent oxidoreductase